MRLRPHSADSTMLRLRPTGSSVGIAPVDYDPVVLLKPFGPRLAADALPSEDSPMAAPGHSRSAYPCPGFRRRASLASPYLPLSSAGEALPPPLDISPGPRAEWDFNPPDASAVRHTLRAAPPRRPASVLSPSQLEPLAACPFTSLDVTKHRFSRSVRKPGRASRRLHAGCFFHLSKKCYAGVERLIPT